MENFKINQIVVWKDNLKICAAKKGAKAVVTKIIDIYICVKFLDSLSNGQHDGGFLESKFNPLIIKVGRNEFTVESGDYILDNGACLQFCTKGRVLISKGFDSYTSVVLTKSAINKINLSTLTKTQVKGFGGKLLTRYTF